MHREVEDLKDSAERTMVTGKCIETPPAAPIREFARLSRRAIAEVKTIRFSTRPYIELAERFGLDSSSCVVATNDPIPQRGDTVLTGLLR